MTRASVMTHTLRPALPRLLLVAVFRGVATLAARASAAVTTRALVVDTGTALIASGPACAPGTGLCTNAAISVSNRTLGAAAVGFVAGGTAAAAAEGIGGPVGALVGVRCCDPPAQPEAPVLPLHPSERPDRLGDRPRIPQALTGGPMSPPRAHARALRTPDRPRCHGLLA